MTHRLRVISIWISSVMFKNLKQKVSSEQGARTPQSTGRNATPNSTPSGRSAVSRLPRPSNSTPLVSKQSSSTNIKETNDNLKRISVDQKQNDKKTFDAGALDSPDIVQQVGDASVNESPNLSRNNSNDNFFSAQTTPVSDKKVPFFKRLEFLTPLKDQFATKLSESKESISSLVDEVRGKNNNDASKPDVVAQTNDRSRTNSTSDTEEMMSQQRSIDVSAIPKEQLFAKVMRLEKMLLTYREKYSELASSHREAKREREKVQSVMQQTQDKNLRRIQELKEAAALDLKAKMHLEEEFRVNLEEKDQVIHVLQTQIAILKDDAPQSPTLKTEDLQSNISSDSGLQKRIKELEEQLKFSNDTCEGLRRQGDALQTQLSERLDEIEKLNESNLSEKSKLIKQLREAKNVIEQIEEDKQTAVAEAKRQMHSVLEGKDNEMISLQDQVNKLKNDLEQFKMAKEKRENTLMEELQGAVTSGRTIEAKLADAKARNDEMEMETKQKLLEIEQSFDSERMSFASELSQLKEDCSKLSENMQNASDSHKNELETLKNAHHSAMQDQSKKHKMEFDEKETQMRLALEERELNKMAAVSQQDTEAQNLLKQLDTELEVVRQKVADLEKERHDEASKHLEDMTSLKNLMMKSDEDHKVLLQDIEKDHKHHLTSKAQEFLEKFTAQKKKFEDKLQARESFWAEKMEKSEQSFVKEIQDVKTVSESQGKDRDELFQQQANKVTFLEKEIETLNFDRAALTNKISEFEIKTQDQDKKSSSFISDLQEMLKKAETDKQDMEIHMNSKDDVIKELRQKIEHIEKDFSQQEQDVLQKSEASNSEIGILQTNLEKMKLQNSALEENVESITSKLRNREEVMKKHVLEMEENHKLALSKLASQLENHQQESVDKLANLEKEKLELQKSFDATNKKFLEAGGRLKALAQKYKTAVSEHQAIVQEKDSIIAQLQTSSKETMQKMQEVHTHSTQMATEKDEHLKKMENEYEEKLSTEKHAMEQKLVDEVNQMKQLHAEEKDTITVDLQKTYDSKCESMISEMTNKFDKEKEKFVNDAKNNFDKEMRNLELRLQSETSNATDKEKSLLQSLHDTQQKLTECETLLSERNKQINEAYDKLKLVQEQQVEDGARLQTSISDLDNMKKLSDEYQKELEDLKEKFTEKEKDLQERDDNISTLSAKLNEAVDENKAEQNNCKNLSAQFENQTMELNAQNSELDKLRHEFDNMVSEKNEQLTNAHGKLESLQAQMAEDSTKFQTIITDSDELKKLSEGYQKELADLKEMCTGKDEELQEREDKINALSAQLKEALDEKITEQDTLKNHSVQIENQNLELNARDSELGRMKHEFQIQSDLLDENKIALQTEKNENEKLKTLCDERSCEIQSISASHSLALEKLDQESKARFSDLEAKAKQKIAQQQVNIKNAKTELAAQLETIQRLNEEKLSAENQLEELKSNLQSLHKDKMECRKLVNTMQEKDEKFAEQLKFVEALTKEAADVEKMKNATIEDLQNKLQSSCDSELEYQSLVQTMRTQILENEERTKSLEAVLEDKKEKIKELEDTSAKHVSETQTSMENLHQQTSDKDSEIAKLHEVSENLKEQLEKLTEDYETTKKVQIEKHLSLQLTQAENENLVTSLQKVKKDFAEKEANILQQLTDVETKSKQEVESASIRLEEESQKKVNDLKKKAETRLAQIKKTFTTQLEEKLKLISQLEDQKTELIEKVKSLTENADGKSNEAATMIEKLESELKSTKHDHANLLEEKEQIQKSWEEEKNEIVAKNLEESEKRIENLLEEERLKNQDEQLQLAEVKDRLEQVLQEAKLKLEETEKKMDEEKDRSDLALQDEKDRRVQCESRLAVAQEDFEKEVESWKQKNTDLTKKIQSIEESSKMLDTELTTAKSDASLQVTALESQLDAARKRSEKLEKDREVVKQNLIDAREEHERQLQLLRDEANSARKQVDVLSKTAVEDKDVEVERKLSSLKEDFDRRLLEKEEETTQKIKKLMTEYESQIHRNNENFQIKIDKLSQRSLSNEDSIRSDHHKELIFLQREIQSRDKKMEETIEKYESEMHQMETNMSEQVDKAMYRAMTAEKKLQDTDVEQENKNLANQLEEIKKVLAETQQREHENLKSLQSLEARVSLATPLADPDKLEYLRRILFEYIMGNERGTMAKVLLLLLQFNDLESQQILEKHGLDQS